MATVGNLVVQIGADTSGLQRGLDNARQQTRVFASGITGTLGSIGKTAFLGIAAGSTMAFGAAAAGAGIASRSAMDFEQSLANVGAIMRASQSEMDMLSARALEMGAQTSFSAKEAADAMYFLASAGYSAAESSEALPGLLSMAAATATDLATASDIATNVLSGFGASVEETGAYADVLAATVSKSNTNLTQLGDALSYVAPNASAVGYAVHDTAAAIGVLSDAGIQASQAGTSLRAVISSLAAPTSQAADLMGELGIEVLDSQGNLKNMPDVVDEFAGALEGMTAAQQQATLNTIFGREAMGAFQVLMNKTGDGLGELASSLENSGGMAEAMAKDQLNTASGALLQLKGSLETVLITLGQAFTPYIKEAGLAAVDFLNNSILPLTEHFAARLPGAIDTLKGALGEIKQAFEGDGFLGGLEAGISKALELMGLSQEEAQKWGGAVKGAGESIASVLGTIGASWEAIAPTLSAAWDALKRGASWVIANFETVKNVVIGVAAGFAAFTILTTVAGWVTSAIAAWGALSAGIATAGGVVSAIVAILGGPLTIAIGAVALAIGVLVAAWRNNWGDIQGKTQAALDFIKGAISAGVEFMSALWANHGSAIVTYLSGVFERLKAVVAEGVSFLRNIKDAYIAYQQGRWYEFGAALRRIWDQTLGRIVTALNTELERLKALMNTFKGGVKTDWGEIGDTIKGLWSSAMDRITQTLTETIPLIISAIGLLIEDIREKFEAVDWGAIGKNVIQGILNGLENMMGSLMDKAREIANNLRSVIEGALNIQSPSRVMFGIGQYVVAGLAQGLEKAATVNKAAESLAESVKAPLQGEMVRPLVPARVAPQNATGAASGPHNGSGNTINISVEVQKVSDQVDYYLLAQRIKQELERSL